MVGKLDIISYLIPEIFQVNFSEIYFKNSLESDRQKLHKFVSILDRMCVCMLSPEILYFGKGIDLYIDI